MSFATYIPLDVSSTDILYTLFYILFIICIFAPPGEFLSAGLTIENLFHRYLGNENMFFFGYHCKRTAIHKLLWSFVVPIYVIFISYMNGSIYNIFEYSKIGKLVYFSIVILPVLINVTNIYLFWYRDGSWSGHPTVSLLKDCVKQFNDTYPDVQIKNTNDLVSQVNVECRVIDKYIANSSGTYARYSFPGKRLIITERLILYSHWSTFKVIVQERENQIAVVCASSAVLNIDDNSSGDNEHNDASGMQTMLTVNLADKHTGLSILKFSIPSIELDQLRSKLQCTLTISQGVVIEPSIVEHFISVFEEAVQENPKSPLSSKVDLEKCIGCMNEISNVQIIKRCDPGNNSEENCGRCNCRPLWCCSCLARWIASRFTASKVPKTEWLSSRAPCPTCRSLFCIDDVARIQ